MEKNGMIGENTPPEETEELAAPVKSAAESREAHVTKRLTEKAAEQLTPVKK